MLTFVEWLANTPASVAVSESTWLFPIVESVHVLGICLFVGMIAMLDLRLLNVTLRRVPVAEVVGRLLPWAFAGFALMIASGALTFLNAPVRYYGNIFFRVKIALLVLAGLNAAVFHFGVYRTAPNWDEDAPPPARAKLAGALSLVLWASIITAGRMIAYNWFDK
jgi:hypothetical protein